MSFTDENNGTAVGWGGTILKTTNGGVTFIDNNETGLPDNFILLQNYPNPFNPTTKISYHLSEQGFVSLKVYNVLGSEIISLVNEEKQAGVYELNFDGSQLASGIYYCRLITNTHSSSIKMLLLK